MPPVGAAIAAAATAIAGAGSVGAVTFFGLTGWAAVGVIAASSLALSALSTALTPKPKSAGAGAQNFSVNATNRTLQIRQPILPRRMVYGEVRVGGMLVYGTSTQNNKYLHFVIVIAAHEVEAINEVWVNDAVVPNDHLDGSGNVIEGKYAGIMRIKKHLGTADQVADADLVAEVPEWSSAHRGRGHAYIYVRMEGKREVFQNDPVFSAVVQGKKVYDTRAAISPVPESVSSATSDTGTIIVSPPSGIEDDEVLIAVAGTDFNAAGNTTYSPPVGFTAGVAYQRANEGAAGVGGQWFWKVANGESGSYSFTETAHRKTHVAILRISGAAATDFLHAVATASNVGTEPTCPSVDTTVANALILNLAIWDESKTLVEAPAGTDTEVHVDENGLDLAVFSDLQPDEGESAEGIVNLTDDTRWITFTIAIAPPTGLVQWTPNSGLQSYDYLSDQPYGVQVVDEDVDEATIIASANACDEIVATEATDYSVYAVAASTNIITLTGDTLMLQRGDRVQVFSTGALPAGLSSSAYYYVIPYQFGHAPRIKLAESLDESITGTEVDIGDAGSGTMTVRKIGEPRYFGGGMIETSEALGNNLRDIMSGMGGSIVCIGGYWSLFAAVYRAPFMSMDENHLRAALEIQTRLPQRERFNGVKGVYVAPFNSWQPADYPAVTNSGYITADGGQTRYQDLDLPFTQRPHTAARLAKIALERSRREITLSYPCKLHALQLQPADTVGISNTRMGWDEKVFEVGSHDLVLDQSGSVPVLGVDLALRETDAAVYNWSASEEGGITPAPRTNLPDPFTVVIPTGVSFDSVPVETLGGDKTYKIKITWNAHEDNFVLNNGKIEARFRETGTSLWRYPPSVDGAATEMELFQAALGLFYDLEIRASNSLGVPSAWVGKSGFMVGSSFVTDSEDWENQTLARDGDDLEADTLSSEDWEA